MNSKDKHCQIRNYDLDQSYIIKVGNKPLLVNVLDYGK